MTYKNKINLIVLVLLSFNSVAQEVNSLGIGDNMPKDVWNSLPKKSSTKLMILDFWATGCGTCIAAFPKMEKLQKEFANDLQIVLVNTHENEARIKEVFDRINKNRSKDKRLGVPASLPALNGLEMFYELFPYTSVPHHVWLNASGKIIAITNGSTANPENIKAILAGTQVSFFYKDFFKETKPLFMGEDQNVNLSEYDQFSFFKRGKVMNVEKVSHSRSLKSKDSMHTVRRGFAMRNVSILQMYRAAISPLYGEVNDKRRTIIEVDQPNSLEWNKEWDKIKTKEEKGVWENENFYSYDILIPELEVMADKQAVPKQILRDLNRYSPYTGIIEKRKVNCLVLTRTSAEDKIKTKGGKTEDKLYDKENPHITNLPIKRIASKLNTNIPILDETNYTGRVDIELGYYGIDILKLRKELQKYDLDLIEAEREIDMFVIRDKSILKTN